MGHAPVGPGSGDGDVTLPVGAVHLHPVPLEPAQRLRGGVPVGVVRADRDQRDPGPARREELRIGVGAAVVRHLEDVGPQVDVSAEDAGLGLGAEVPGEQDRDPAGCGADDHRQVVRRCGRRRPPRIGGEHLQRQFSDGAPVAGQQGGALTARVADEGVDPADALVGGRQRARRDDADVPAGQGSRQSPGVVGVEVRQEDQGQFLDAEPAQAPVHRADVGARVHQHRGAWRRGQDDGVALADVARHRDCLRRRPAADRLAQRPAERDQAQDRGHGERSEPGEAPQGQSGREHQDEQQEGTTRAVGPADRAVRHVRGRLPHDDQPAGGPAGEPHEQVREGGQRDADERGAEAQHRGRRDRWCGEQVGRERDEADRPVQAGDQRRGRETGGGAHGERIREHRRAPPLAEPARPPGCQQDDGGGRGDREREARVRRQSRVGQQEHDARRREGRHRGPGPSRRQRQQRDRSHGSGPDHARARPGQDDEADQSETGDDRLHPPVDGATPQRPQEGAHDDGHVGPGHGSEVGQTGPAEVLLQHRVHGARVAHDQTRQQTPGLGIEDAPGRVGQRVAQGGGGPLWVPRVPRQSGRPACGQHRHQRFAAARQGDTDPRAHLLPGEKVPPSVGRREDQHGGVSPLRWIAPCGHRRVEQDAGVHRSADQLRVAVHLEHHGRAATVLGDRTQW
jgi:hypothetical protein